MVIPEADYLYEGLLRHNYLPLVKERRDDIPPLFSTEALAPGIGNQLIAHYDQLRNEDKKRRNQDGFDQIEYRTTRFNNVLRLMHIPHPLPFARLCVRLRDHWDRLEYICTNQRSQIKPARHSGGRVFVVGEYDHLAAGRVVVMEKDRFPEEANEILTLSLGASYRVDADVSSCFPSLYIHAVPWALVGHPEAKRCRAKKTLWYNQLDMSQRQIQRNETKGVPIGPATSNIMTEVVLARVDEALANKKYRFLRYIDDYKCYCTTREEADGFIRDLEQELNAYLLALNTNKLAIFPLPIPSKPSWLTELSDLLPREQKLTERAIADYLDRAVRLQAAHPEGSVVKYAARSLAGGLSRDTARFYCRYILQLAFHYPVVLPVLCEVVKHTDVTFGEDDLTLILDRQITYRRSDMICWTLYLTSLMKKVVPEDVARRVVEIRDCMGMAALLAIGQQEADVIDFVGSLDHCDAYELDKNWLLVHELTLRDELQNGSLNRYVDTSGFRLLMQENVSFLAPPVWRRTDG